MKEILRAWWWVVAIVFVVVGGIVVSNELSPAGMTPQIDYVAVTTSSVKVPAEASSSVPVALKAAVKPVVVPAPRAVDDSGSLRGDEKAILDGVNAIREAQSLPSLVDVAQLNEAAQDHAEDMASKGYFAHNSPDGIQYTHWGQVVGYQWSYYGENLGEGFSDPQTLIDAWHESPDHFANIANANYTETGLGEATGTYEGQVTEFVVQVFGSPK